MGSRVLPRPGEVSRVHELLRRNAVVGILGARQVGKSTLARMGAKGRRGAVTFFDLENDEDLSRLADPLLALKGLRGLVVLDEIQRVPDIYRTLRVLADRPEKGCRFLVLGSASPHLLRQSAESLAGRIAYFNLGGFSLEEVGARDLTVLWRRGGLPRSFLAASETESLHWRQQFIRTFLERDLSQLGIRVASGTLRRFWTMLAHCHGQVWNASEFARCFGVADTTVRHYLDVLAASLVVRQLLPWHENIGKRQVKAPKVFVADSGLLHALLNLPRQADIDGHPKSGASWEGFALEQVAHRLRAGPEECFFWATHAGAELDLLVVRGRQRRGFEMKRSSAPRITPSMRVAMKDLRLSSLDVIHAGEHTFDLAPRIRAVSLNRLLEDLRPL